MRCGFIGYGNMGSALVKALIRDGSLQERDVVVHNRTPERLADLVREHPRVRVADSLSSIAGNVDVLFICVHSTAVPDVLSKLGGALHPETHLITINGGVNIADLEAVHGGPVSKVIPSITIGTGRGIALMSHGKKVSRSKAEALEMLLSRSSKVMVLPEEKIGAATDMTSCGPGLMASMISHFASSGARAGRLDPKEAMALTLETLMGTALLLSEKGETPSEITGRVATPGGITEHGLKVLNAELPAVLDRMFEATGRKRAEVKGSLMGAGRR
jgi:pyrroline-5-carboxylate reductase